MKLLVFMTFIFSFFANSFDYLVETHAKRKIVKSFELQDNQKFISFILDGTWSDNLGNYGFIEQASTVVLSENRVIKLDGYGKTIYQNKEVSYFRGFRDQQEKDAGVGKTVIIESSENLKGLIGIECDYAVKFLEDTAYVLSRCDINNEQKDILINMKR